MTFIDTTATVLSIPPVPNQNKDPNPEGLRADNWSSVKIDFAFVVIWMAVSGHNFKQDTAPQLSWHAQNWGLKWLALLT